MTKFLVFDIGCIECGEPSEVVGIYPDQATAQAAVIERAGNPDGSYFGDGQHQVDIFELDDLA